jgi:hypothetical protein
MPSFRFRCLRLACIAALASSAGCVAADPDADVFGHEWTITVASSTVAPTEPDGTAWDSDGSAPDPYAKVYYNDALLTTTPNISNSYTATWDDVLPPFTIDRGDKLRVEEYDSDPIGDGDLILICPGEDVEVQADELRAGEIMCSDAGSTLFIDFAEDDTGA